MPQPGGLPSEGVTRVTSITGVTTAVTATTATAPANEQRPPVPIAKISGGPSVRLKDMKTWVSILQNSTNTQELIRACQGVEGFCRNGFSKLIRTCKSFRHPRVSLLFLHFLVVAVIRMVDCHIGHRVYGTIRAGTPSAARPCPLHLRTLTPQTATPFGRATPIPGRSSR